MKTLTGRALTGRPVNKEEKGGKEGQAMEKKKGSGQERRRYPFKREGRK